MSVSHTILLVEQPSTARDALVTLLGDEGYVVKTADSGDHAIALVHRERPTVVIADLEAPSMAAALGCIAALPHAPEVIAVTDFGCIAPALTALRDGAADYIIKPIRADELSFVLAKAVEHHEMTREIERLRAQLVAARPLQ